MSIYAPDGKPAWHPKPGTVATQRANRRKRLVRMDKASPFIPYRNVDGAVDAAGLLIHNTSEAIER